MEKISASFEHILQDFIKSVNGSVYSWRMDKISSNFELECEDLLKSVKILLKVPMMQ
jgi:hypothetical protein